MKQTSSFDITKPDLRYEVTYPINPETLPEGAVETDDGVLFKQTGDLFKQIHDQSGKVIGLMYKGPRSQSPSTLGMSQAKSRLNIYRKRSEAGEVSDAVQRGLEMWEWANNLFGAEKFARTENMQTIHETEPVEAVEV